MKMKNLGIRPIRLIGPIGLMHALAALALALAMPAFAAEAKPEKSDVVVTYAQASGAFTPIWVAFEAGLYKKYGLNAKVQLMKDRKSTSLNSSHGYNSYAVFCL